MIHTPNQIDFETWRSTARALLTAEAPPESIHWRDDAGPSLFSPSTALPEPSPGLPLHHVPADFLRQVRQASCHRDSGRWSLFYRLLWRLTHGEPQLLSVLVDDDVYTLMRMAKSVTRDAHKMKAFVRFRSVTADDGEHFIAWHRPDHLIVPLVAPFFADRFAPMKWTILTPDASVAWDTHILRYGPGMPASSAPAEDAMEAFWTTYYAAIFNPARLNVEAMCKEMPRKHWATLPEAALIPDLLQGAAQRVEVMMKTTRPAPATASTTDATCPPATSAAEFLPKRLSLKQLRISASACRGCDLYCQATQTVFGEGPATASLMFVGEQPGDHEDLAGKPFVGPSGRLLNEALEAAGIPRDDVYVTNAVKHFKFTPRGKRRIHAKPSVREVQACRPWLEAEIKLIRPQLIICLGATAAQSLLGPQFRLTQHRGEFFESPWAPALLATNHPAAILRIPDPTLREQSKAAFLADLHLAAKRLGHP